MEKTEKKVSIILLIIVLAVAAFLSLATFFTDLLWFKEMEYLSVFFKQLVTMLEVGIPTFVVVTFLAHLYLSRLRKGYFNQVVSSEDTNMKSLKVTSNILSIVYGLAIAGVTAVKLWFNVLQFANSSDFGVQDPIFGLDVSFYVFKLDFLTILNELLIVAIIGLVILTVIYYVVLLSVRTPDMFKKEEETYGEADDDRYTGSDNPFENGNQRTANLNDFADKFSKMFRGKGIKARPVKSKKQFDDGNFKVLLGIASGKITILGVIFFLMIGVNFFLRQFDLLHAHTGAVYGAGFTDVNITLWVLRILCVLAVVAAVMTVVHMKKKEYRKILTIPVIMILVGVVGVGAEALVQNFIVSPDELDKETKYLERNIQYTQSAYDLDDVTSTAFAADSSLTAKDIVDNGETISNIRINDFDPAKQFYNQTQSIRQYYIFEDVDNDRYMIDGQYTQAYVATREIDESKISDTWLNRHLKYTHGYGITLSRVDKVTSSGQPDVLVGNIPPESSIEGFEITRPEIYFGEISNDYIIVGTNEKEFDYPSGDTNAYTKYEGTAGIKLNLVNRALFSIREASLKLLVSSNISSDSKIIINRNVVDRVKKIMPYLSYEADPYMVVSDGKLYWMLDAYTTSTNYPYSQPYSTESAVNYIRNSIKVVVDAYNGDVKFYIVDEEDPIAKTYQKIYPKLFKDKSEMPEGLVAHIRYPNTLLEIQAKIYARYHMEDISVFYLSEDMWDIAYEIYGTEKTQITPTYYIAKLPGQSKAEFFNSVPFTPKDKRNMTALLVARNDGENYGQLVLYQFPKSRTIYGPEQVEAQIDQNTEISKEFALWNSSGTTYRRGNMFVIPIKSSILYVEPVYLEATNSSIPEVKRIIVAYGDKIAYEETLAECLVSLFGSDAADGIEQGGGSIIDDNDEPTDTTNWVDKAVSAFNKAQSASQSGDWASYGKYIKELEEALNHLEG